MQAALDLVKALAARQENRLRRNIRDGLHFWRTWLRSLYFPDEVHFYGDSFIRLVFCFYYIPAIVFTLAVTHSALQRVVWVLVQPVTQEMERNPFHFSSLQTLGVGLSQIALKMLPFAALGCSFATVGHKATNGCAEAMLDAYTAVKDRDYPLFHARLQFMLEKRSRTAICLGVMAAMAVMIVYAFQQNTIAILSRDEPQVLLVACGIVLVQGGFILYTVVTGAPAEVVDAVAGSFAEAAEKVMTSIRSPKQWSGGSRKRKGSGTRGGPTSPTGSGGGGGADHQERPLASPMAGRYRSSGGSEPGSAAISPADGSAFGTHGGGSNSSGGSSGSFSSATHRTPHNSDSRSSSSNNYHHHHRAQRTFLPDSAPPSRTVRCVGYFLGGWWSQNIHYMRHIGFGITSVFGLHVALTGGPLQGMTSTVLLIMCLNFPHLFTYMSLMVTFAVIRTLRSFQWLSRHRDAFLPFLVVDLPYQLVLASALLHFRRHAWTVSLLLGVNILLVARAIDLVREYDVSAHGAVLWEAVAQRPRTTTHMPATTTRSVSNGTNGGHHGNTDNTPNLFSDDDTTGTDTAGSGSGNDLVTPSLAIILEDAYEKRQQRPGLVSLDMTIDIRHMRIHYADYKKTPDVALVRRQIIPHGAARRYLRDRHFYVYVFPRLLSLQSPGYFAGAQYRKARILLRAVSITGLFVFTSIVIGMIVQAAFPQLRPLPVRVSGPLDGSYLTVDHVVLRMHMLSAQTTTCPGGVNEGDEDGEATTMTTTRDNATAMRATTALALRGGVPNAAHAVFQWSNITSDPAEDFYPRLCTRDYYGTSVWELSLLAMAPYLFSTDDVDALLGFMNTHLGSDWVIKQRHGSSCLATDSAHSPTGWAGFYDFYSAARDTSVIGIRGTDFFSFSDFLIDINLFFETVVYQVMTYVIPGSIVVPRDLVMNLIRVVSLRTLDEPAEDIGNLDGSFAARRAATTWAALVASNDTALRRCRQNNYRRDFFADVENHLTYVATHPEEGRRPTHVVLTGHSLGGAVAAIVADHMDVEAVGLSAPGIALARKKFNVEMRGLNTHMMTVVSTNDIVPMIGTHGGELHHVECLAAKRELCHAVENMVGSLWRSCGSVRARFPGIADLV